MCKENLVLHDLYLVVIASVKSDDRSINLKVDNLSESGERFYSTYSGNSISSGYRRVLQNSTNPLILSSRRVGIRLRIKSPTTQA